MSKNKPWAKWVLPDIVDPAGRRCFVIRVPDEPNHIAAFRGAMLNLASAYKWSDDIDHTAKDVALVWREVINDMGDCQVFDVRQNPTDPCILQKYDSDLGSWVDFANMADCVQSQLPPDNPPGRSQPGENDNGPTPAVGHCYVYDLTLHANSHVLVPVEIHPGYTIEFSDPRGATRTSTDPLSTWRCYDGGLFVLGACTGIYSNVGTDPIPTENHGRVVMQVPDGTWHALTPGAPYTVPAGMPDGNYIIQINDDPISNNDGDITFRLKVCSNAAIITANVGAVSQHTVGVGDLFTVSSVPWPGACGVDEYSDFGVNTPLTLEVVSMTYCLSCAFSGANQDIAIWSAFPSSRWYWANGPLSGVLANPVDRWANWSGCHFEVTFRVLAL